MPGAAQQTSGGFRASDEAHIERLRHAVERFDRWRRPLLILYVVITGMFIGAVVAAMILLERLSRGLGNQNARWGGFLWGLVIGVCLGLMALKIGHGIVDILLGYRNERLLIKYHDALEELGGDV